MLKIIGDLSPPKMMLRHVIAILMILTGLSLQARTDFSCQRMGGAVLEHCCCHAAGMSGGAVAAADDPCCNRVASAKAPLSWTSSRHGGMIADHLLAPDLATATLLAVSLLLFLWGGSHLASRVLHTTAYVPSFAGTYFRTARLRL